MPGMTSEEYERRSKRGKPVAVPEPPKVDRTADAAAAARDAAVASKAAATISGDQMQRMQQMNARMLSMMERMTETLAGAVREPKGTTRVVTAGDFKRSRTGVLEGFRLEAVDVEQ